MSPKFLVFRVPLGSLWAPFLLKNRYFFQWKISSLFWSSSWGILAPFWLHFPLQIWSKIDSEAKTVVLRKWAFRVHESSIFEGRDPRNLSKRPPRSYQESDAYFHRKNGWKMMPKGSQKELKIASKCLQQTTEKTHQKNEKSGGGQDREFKSRWLP